MIINYRFKGWRPEKFNLWFIKDKIVPEDLRESLQATSCPNCHQDFYPVLEAFDVCNPEDVAENEGYKDHAIEIICACKTRVLIWFDYELEAAADWMQELVEYNNPQQVSM
jgi:hypothetical protein